ncbi:hypothetical protein HPGAM_01650 [Helicobacter pylori Gambia94/24]|nr:hypothetical protein HPGAM_01650 [Helicobacter pylori Gambia94/24]
MGAVEEVFKIPPYPLKKMSLKQNNQNPIIRLVYA